MKAIGYCRLRPCDGLSAAEHVEGLKAKAEAMGYDIATVLVERTEKGQRPSLCRVLAQARVCGAGAVIVPFLSHLTRESSEFLRIWQVLSENGVELVSAKGEDMKAVFSICQAMSRLACATR